MDHCPLSSKQASHQASKQTNKQTKLRYYLQIVAVDKSSGTAMAVLRLSDAVSRHYGPEVTATHVLPLVCPLLISPALDGARFATAMKVRVRGWALGAGGWEVRCAYVCVGGGVLSSGCVRAHSWHAVAAGPLMDCIWA